MAESWPDILSYRNWARVPDTDDDCAIAAALAAVIAAIEARCPRLFGPTPHVPDDAYQAALLWTNRVFARRNSPEGVIGVSDMGVVTVGRWDPDVQRLLSPYVDPVLA
jgi:gamma-glutamyl:cysteine ligase YbdK (ATP-grasp superfamily)